MMIAAAIAAAIGSAGALAIAYRVRRLYLVVTVVGGSMQPAFASGDRLLVRRTTLDRVRRGAAVVVTLPAPGGPDDPPPNPAHEVMVKRAVALPGDAVPDGVKVADALVPPHHLVVIGDNPNGSYDSRYVGYVPAQALLGVVVRRMAIR